MGLLFQIYQTMQEQEAELYDGAPPNGGPADDERISLLDLLVHPVGMGEPAMPPRERGDGRG